MTRLAPGGHPLDNFQPAHPRPFDVDSLEDRLRRSFADTAAEVTPRSEFAERAIRRGRRIRRGRTTAGLLAVIATTALTGAGAAIMRGQPGGTPVVLDTSVPELPAPDPTPSLSPSAVSPSLAPSSVPVDLVLANTLLLANGGRIDLTGIGRITEGYATDDGWLIRASSPDSTATESLWYASPVGGVPKRLLDADAGAVAVAPDGTRVAWRDAAGLFVADLDEGALVQPAHVAPWTDAVPVGFTGDAVRLRSAGTEELWSPEPDAEGSRRPTEASQVYGALPDGRSVGLTVRATDGGEEYCLAMLDADLRADRTVCGLDLIPGGTGWVSPGGRWLVAEVSTASGTRGALIDLTAIFAERQPRTVPIEGAPAGGAAWEDEDTVVRALRGSLERLHLDRLWAGQAGGIQVLSLGGSQGHDLIVVTRWAR